MSQQQLDDIFERVVFDEADRAFHKSLYAQIKVIASSMDAYAPDSADKTLAFRALHMALMHYGAALSKQDKYKK